MQDRINAPHTLIEDDHVVQTLAPNGSDHALDVGILPWTERARHDLGDPKAGDPLAHAVVVDAVPVSEQSSWCGVIGERLDELLGGPGGGRMVGAIDRGRFAAGCARSR
jgi:hypothetical protein